jgi:hypothetical protein
VSEALVDNQLLAASDGKASLLEINRAGSTFFFGFHKN